MRENLIIDCDPGYDDAIALIMAFASEFNVLAVTTAAGNQSVENTTKNAVGILSFLNAETLLAKGAAHPLKKKLQRAAEVHGESGFRGLVLPSSHKVDKKNAVDLTAELLKDNKVTIAASAPLTNIALLLSKYPEVKENIERLVLMGGGITHGNVTKDAEFNIYADPDAAKIVFNSGIPLVMCPLDVTEKAYIEADEIERVRKAGRAGELVASLLDSYGGYHKKLGFKGPVLHDPCVIAYLADHGMFKTKAERVDVDEKTGRTFIAEGKPNALICYEIDRPAFIEYLIKCCARYENT